MNGKTLGILCVLFVATACGEETKGKVAVPGQPGASKTVAANRALRRAYDGAPPVIPHQDFAAACLSCHLTGMAVPDVGFAPTVPHANVAFGGAMGRCRQCHVYAQTDEIFAGSEFVGFAQDLRKGDRLHEFAPPRIPHQMLLRENCLACHDGPAAREEIRCSHPERTRCLQCHVPMNEASSFVR